MVQKFTVKYVLYSYLMLPYPFSRCARRECFPFGNRVLISLSGLILCQNFLRADSLLPFIPGVENSIKFLCSFEDGLLCDESTESILKDSLLLLSSQVQQTQQILDHLRAQVMLRTTIPQQTASWNTPRWSEQGYGLTQVIPSRAQPLPNSN